MHPALIVLIVAAGLFALAVAFGMWLASIPMGIKRHTPEHTLAWYREHHNVSEWLDPLEKSEYQTVCRDGYRLYTLLLKNPELSDRYVIISHGYTSNRYGGLKYAKPYLDLGFNVILYDLRGHGTNAKTFCTYSVRESMDLCDLVADTRSRYPSASLLGIHGESLGGATVCASMKYAPNVDFAVSDCGFAEIGSILKTGLRHMHLPMWVINWAAVCSKVRYGYNYREMRPIDSLPGNRIPMMFIHGDRDEVIPPDHSARMASTTEGVSVEHYVKGAGHGKSVFRDPAGYTEFLRSFIEALPPKVENDTSL